MKIAVQNVRLAFPSLFEPQSFGEGEPAFSASLLMAPDHPAVKTIVDAMTEAAVDKWKDKASAMLKQLKATDKLALHDGATKASYAGFEGNLFLSTRNRARPVVVDRDRTPLAAADGKPYAGCYVNASVDIWVQDNQYGKRVNATLLGIQFLRDGEAFGGGATGSADDFEVLDSAEGGDFGADDSDLF